MHGGFYPAATLSAAQNVEKALGTALASRCSQCFFQFLRGSAAPCEGCCSLPFKVSDCQTVETPSEGCCSLLFEVSHCQTVETFRRATAGAVRSTTTVASASTSSTNCTQIAATIMHSPPSITT